MGEPKPAAVGRDDDSVAAHFNLRCPKCGRDDAIRVACRFWHQLLPKGRSQGRPYSEIGFNIDFDNESPAACDNCAFGGLISAFRVTNQKPRKIDDATALARWAQHLISVVQSLSERQSHYADLGVSAGLSAEISVIKTVIREMDEQRGLRE